MIKSKQANRPQRSDGGGATLLFPRGSVDAMWLKRPVRQISGLTFRHLGDVLIALRLDQMVNAYRNVPTQFHSVLAIFRGNRPIYATDSKLPLNGIQNKLGDRSGYFTTMLGHTSYFVAFASSTISPLTYVQIVPAESVFIGVARVKMMLIAMILFVGLLTVFFGMRLAAAFTRPIEKLSSDLKRLGDSESNLDQLLLSTYSTEDEVGTFYRSFHHMVSTIANLARENSRAVLDLREAELKSLQAQINPHFLYNTLDSINWIAQLKRQPQIAEIARSLGTLLRAAITHSEPVITLQEEHELLSRYLFIQRMRFQERLKTVFSIDENTLHYRIPKLTLQPIVENSIRHGLETRKEACTVTISARLVDEDLVVSVADDGPGMDEAFVRKLADGRIEPASHSIGLKNIQNRIRILFGPNYGLHVDSKRGRGTRVSIMLPATREGARA